MGKTKFHFCLENKKRRISKFYRQQTNTVESFETDSKHVQVVYHKIFEGPKYIGFWCSHHIIVQILVIKYAFER